MAQIFEPWQHLEWIRFGEARPCYILNAGEFRIKVNRRSWYIGRPEAWWAPGAVENHTDRGECGSFEEGFAASFARLQELMTEIKNDQHGEV